MFDDLCTQSTVIIIRSSFRYCFNAITARWTVFINGKFLLVLCLVVVSTILLPFCRCRFGGFAVPFCRSVAVLPLLIYRCRCAWERKCWKRLSVYIGMKRPEHWLVVHLRQNGNNRVRSYCCGTAVTAQRQAATQGDDFVGPRNSVPARSCPLFCVL